MCLEARDDLTIFAGAAIELKVLQRQCPQGFMEAPGLARGGDWKAYFSEKRRWGHGYIITVDLTPGPIILLR